MCCQATNKLIELNFSSWPESIAQVAARCSPAFSAPPLPPTACLFLPLALHQQVPELAAAAEQAPPSPPAPVDVQLFAQLCLAPPLQVSQSGSCLLVSFLLQ
jgi:hypothetical protein